MPRKKRTKTRPRPTENPPLAPEGRVVAVTGAHGFFGSQVIRSLEEDRRYRKILAIDIRRPELPLEKTQFHRVDLTMPSADVEMAAVLEREGVDTLLHAAFHYQPAVASSWPDELERIGTVHVLSAAAEARLRKLVVWSLTDVYGAHPDNPNYLSEDHPLRGQAHGRSVADRVEAELEVRRFRAKHPRTLVTVLRTARTIGPSICNFATRLFRNPVVPVLIGRDPLWQLLHEEDAVDAFKLALDEDVDGDFNIVGDGVLPYSTVLAMMGRVPLPLPACLAFPLAQAAWATELVDMPPAFLDFLRFVCVADGSRAQRRLGFVPRYDIRATIHDFLGLEMDTGDFACEGGRT